MPSEWDKQEKAQDKVNRDWADDTTKKSVSASPPTPTKDITYPPVWQKWGLPAGLTLGILIGLAVGYALTFLMLRP